MAYADTNTSRPHVTVGDVMTTPVVAVARIATYREIARALAKHHIGGLPVLLTDQRVAGVVSEADLVAARDGSAWRRQGGAAGGRRVRGWIRGRRAARTAGELMTAPAVTIGPGVSVADAARAMSEHRVGRLPVVGPNGRLIGIVSRGDLLSALYRVGWARAGAAGGQEPSAGGAGLRARE